MPAEIGVHTTGHDLTDLSALWEYVGARLALCMPGAITLSGFPSLPWGQLGKGPVPPSLRPLIEGGVSEERLDNDESDSSCEYMGQQAPDGSRKYVFWQQKRPRHSDAGSSR